MTPQLSQHYPHAASFRQGRNCSLASSSKPAADPEQCCDATSGPPRLWIAPLDCKQLSRTAETNKYHTRHSIAVHLPQTELLEKSLPPERHLTFTHNCLWGTEGATHTHADAHFMLNGFYQKCIMQLLRWSWIFLGSMSTDGHRQSQEARM